MKRILAMLLALMLVSAMTVGFVAYADEPVAEETPVETVEEAAPATPSQEDFESMMQYMTYDFTKPDVVVISSYVTGSENLLNYFKDSFRNIFSDGVTLLDGSGGTVNNLHRVLAEKNLLEQNTGDIRYYTSGREAEELRPQYDLLLNRLEKMLQY